jgi:hypothetical protein
VRLNGIADLSTDETGLGVQVEKNLVPGL